MEYESFKLLLNCIIRSDILLACLGIVVSFVCRHLFPCYLIKETIFFNILIWNIWHLKCSEKCSSKSFHKFVLLRIYILKDSRKLFQKWACQVQKCKSTSHGITIPDVVLEKKQKYVKPKMGHVTKFQQKISSFEKFVAKYVFFKISIWDIHNKANKEITG